MFKKAGDMGIRNGVFLFVFQGESLAFKKVGARTRREHVVGGGRSKQEFATGTPNPPLSDTVT